MSRWASMVAWYLAPISLAGTSAPNKVVTAWYSARVEVWEVSPGA